MKILLGKIIVLCAIAFGTSTFAQEDVRDRIRSAIIESLVLPEAFQYVTFGPLLDDRVVELRIRFHSEGGNPSVRKTDAADDYLVEFPRQGLITSPFIEDAMMGCFINTEVCPLMQSYLLRLKQVGQPSELLFFEEAYPEHTATFSNLRQQAFWGPAVLGGIQSAILAVDTHEICHVVLGHLDDRTGLSPLEFEGEADGCMLYFFRIAELNPVGGLAYLMDALFSEEVLGEFRITHPAPSCRSLALAEASIDWLNANRGLFEEVGANNALPSPDALRHSFADQAGQRAVECSDYNQAVSAGRERAASLFDENTNLTSDP